MNIVSREINKCIAIEKLVKFYVKKINLYNL